jgi:CO dehydrogenase/acetyl-CoA synthase delta subunit
LSSIADRHRLAAPRRARVRADPRDGRPLAVDGREVDAVRESWLVEDRWWTERPLRRRYWEVVTTCGRNVVVFHDLREGGWYRQR